MYKIIKLTSDEVIVGLPDGGIEKYPISSINYQNPKINDCVEIFKDNEEVIITKKSSTLGESVINEFNNLGGNNAYGKEVNKLVYVLLAFFVGSFGIHKFYAGKTFLGVIYLLFCWTGIPSIISLIEAIIALFKPADAYGRITV